LRGHQRGSLHGLNLDHFAGVNFWIEVPAGARAHASPNATVFGYPFDGGFLAPA
jgi:hypothetical protein